MGSPFTVKKHGVIVHPGSPLAGKATEKEYMDSLRPEPIEASALLRQNRDLFAQRRAASHLQRKFQKQAVALINQHKFKKLLERQHHPTCEDLVKQYPTGLAEALISLLRSRGQLRE